MMTKDEREKVRLTLQTSGWLEVMAPRIKARQQQFEKIGRLFPNERPEPYKSMDDSAVTVMARTEARCWEWFLNSFQNEVMIGDHNDALEAAVLERQA